MKVTSLKINSFRGIGDLTLEFNPDKPTVFIGINGVGKSSILDCLAILLSWFVNRISFYPGAKKKQRPRNPNIVELKRKTGTIKV